MRVTFGYLNSNLANIDVYVDEEDGKIHFVDSAGADTVLNFSSASDYEFYGIYHTRSEDYAVYDHDQLCVISNVYGTGLTPYLDTNLNTTYTTELNHWTIVSAGGGTSSYIKATAKIAGDYLVKYADTTEEETVSMLVGETISFYVGRRKRGHIQTIQS